MSNQSVWSGGWTNFDTSPRRNYLDQPAKPYFTEIEDSTEAGQVYAENMSDGYPATINTNLGGTGSGPVHHMALPYREYWLQQPIGPHPLDGMKVMDILEWLNPGRPEDAAPITPLGAASDTETTEKPLQERMNEDPYCIGSAAWFAKREGPTEKPIDFLDDANVAPSKEYLMEMDALKLGNRYARLKEVARTLVKIGLVDGYDCDEFNQAMADLVEEL